MIAGITHLTMEAGLHRGVELGTGLGFRLEFLDNVTLPGRFEGVENGTGVDDSDDVLPLALLAADQGIRLEVVEHRRRSGRPGAWTGLFRCPPPTGSQPAVGVVAGGAAADRSAVREVLRQADVLPDPQCVVVPASGGQAWFDPSPPAGGLAGLLCHAHDVRAEADFWTSFARFRFRSVDADVACGYASSPLPQARCAFVIIRADEPASGHAMNDCGFPSIGVFSTAIDRDWERARSAGATLKAAPISTTVGPRSVRMALIETPNGAPVELLSIQQQRR
jgi:hypothetical protein